MRNVALVVALGLPTMAMANDEQRAEKSFSTGLEAMREAMAGQAGSGLVVEAAVELLRARRIYEDLGDDDKIAEIQSYLYLCKKKMTNAEVDQYLAAKASDGDDRVTNVERIVERVSEAVDVAVIELPPATDALARVEAFAEENPTASFRVFAQYLEIAERYVESDPQTAIIAQKRSQAAMDKWMDWRQKQLAKAHDEAQSTLAAIEALSIFEAPFEVEPMALPVPKASTLRHADRSVAELYPEEVRAKASVKLARHWFNEARRSKEQPDVCYALIERGLEAAQDKEVRDVYLVQSMVRFVARWYVGVDASKRLDAVYKRMGAVGSSARRLVRNPQDPEANQVVGLAIAFNSKRMEDALPLLRKADDASLAKVARMELIGPKTADEMRQVADTWHDLAGGLAYRDHVDGLRGRALHWYRQAVKADAKGAPLAHVEQRIEELKALVPVDPKTVDWNSLSVQQWDRLDGKIGQCEAQKGIKTKLVLRPGKVYRLVPHPKDAWVVHSYSHTFQVDWRGEQIG
ncbi:MAG: hypothetical protein ACYTF0_06620, partial [Planctomycetota bacterium]